MEILRLYKSVSDWLKMLPLDITELNMEKYFLLNINVTKRNDFCLNVKGNYMLFVEKNTFEFIQKKLGLNLIEIQNNAIQLIFGCFFKHPK